jgi:hypothetical protein
LAALRKHLKSGIGERYESRTNYLTVILDRNTKNVQIIARAKDTQWKVVICALLLFIAIAAAVQLTHRLMAGLVYETIVGAGAAIGVALIWYVARNMMVTIEHDLAFYREHGRLNDEMLNMTVGIQALASKVVSTRREALSSRHDFSSGAEDNRLTFTPWLNGIIGGAAIAALLVCQLIIWIGNRN